MKRWDKSYTYEICTVVFFAIVFLVANIVDNRSFKFDGYEPYQAALEQWAPEIAKETNESPAKEGWLFIVSTVFLKSFLPAKNMLGLRMPPGISSPAM